MMSLQKKYVPPVMFHPGVILKEKLEELNMPVKEFALRCQKPEKTIYAVLDGDSGLTSGMAVQFENVLRIPASFWLNLQSNYDEFKSRKKLEEETLAAEEWARHFPWADMVKKGLVPQVTSRKIIERIQALLKYFGIAKYKAWEEYYQKQTLKTMFRISLRQFPDPYALSAWLRHGEIAVSEHHPEGDYSPDKLKSRLPQMLKLANEENEGYLDKLVELCQEAGVVLVYTPHLEKSTVQGATRWINGCPLIQMSDRFKRYDIFWFSFFHEIGHILKHNRKEIFLEGVDYDDKNVIKEQEADEFASNQLIPKHVAERLKRLDFSHQHVLAFSKFTGIHLAFIVGRLQHQGKIAFSVGQAYIPHVHF